MNKVVLNSKYMAVAAIICAAAVSSCQDKPAQQVPLSDDQLLYDQARLELPEQDQLEEMVDAYRRELYIEKYLNLLLEHKVEAVAEEECRRFYDEFGKDLKMEEAIVKGLIIKTPLQNRKNTQLHNWLVQLSQGKEDCMVELEQWCSQRASSYDNFMNYWVRLNRLTDQLPVTVVDPRQFLSIKAYEMDDQDYEYHFVVTDYRLAGEVQPYEWAKSDILDLLVQRRRASFRDELVKQLREK